jgi:hypothetical protein
VGWHSCPVANDTERPDPIEPDLDDLVGEWLTVPDVAERLGLPLAAVRTMLQEREVLGVRRGERRVVSIPARFFAASGPLPELPGTFTVLSDGGMHDEEILRWLFTPDETLPVPGAPIDSLHAGFKTEIRRRAMETAF